MQPVRRIVRQSSGVDSGPTWHIWGIWLQVYMLFGSGPWALRHGRPAGLAGAAAAGSGSGARSKSAATAFKLDMHFCTTYASVHDGMGRYDKFLAF